MKTLAISWQRLVTAGGETCGRCGATEKAVQDACASLREALRPLGIEVTLEVRAIDAAAFEADPSESNRIWIAGQPMEHWLGAAVGSSRCCDACGGADCRTVEFQGEAYEAIPEKLILQAALSALPHLAERTGPAAAG